MVPSSANAFARFRMLMAYLYGRNQKAALVALGISRKLYLALEGETQLPDAELQSRIYELSKRWNYGAIFLDDWPKPALDRRGQRRVTAA